MDTNPIPVLLVLLTLATGLVLLRHRVAARRRSRWDRVQPSQLVQLSRTLFPVLLAVLLLRSFVGEPFRIPSSSMHPTLEPGDFILVNKYRYGLYPPLLRIRLKQVQQPERGDVAVFFPPGRRNYFIKRVVGLPGDRIHYRNKRLFINNREIPVRIVPGTGQREERLGAGWHPLRLDPQRQPQNFSAVVRPGHYFMMGDNRDNSQDSRFWGQVPERDVVGPAVAVWMHWRGITQLPSFRQVRRIP